MDWLAATSGWSEEQLRGFYGITRQEVARGVVETGATIIPKSWLRDAEKEVLARTSSN